MTLLSREDLRNHLKKREFAPVYVLFGAETYLRDLAAKTLTDFVLKDASLREFNETEYSLTDADVSHALAAAEQLPMMSAKRVVKISNVLVSANANKDNLKEEHEEILASYLNRPSISSVVIFIADEFDKRRKIAKLLLENSVAVEFKILDEPDLIKWAREKLKEFKADADEGALRHLVALIGNNVRRLTIEIEKLAVAALPDKLITFELVESLVPDSRELSNFDLTDHLLANNKTRALQVLKKTLDDGAEPLMLLGLLAYNFRRLLLSKELMRQGVERKEVARVMKLHWSKQEDFLATARRGDAGKMARVMERLAETDRAIKNSVGGANGARLHIEMLVCELTDL